MKTKIVVLILFVYSTSMLFAQVGEKDFIEHYTEAIDNVFSELPTHKITTGVLIERSIATLNISDYTGAANSEICDLNAWQKLYKQLYLGHLNPENYNYDESMPSKLPSSHSLGDNIDLGLIVYDYNKMDPEALKNRELIIDTVKGKILDRTPNNKNPFIIETCFAATPMVSELAMGIHNFYINPDWFISNKKEIGELYIDFDDGKGYVSAEIGRLLPVVYDETGKKNITVKAIIDAKNYFSYCSLNVYNDFQLKSAKAAVVPQYGPQDFVHSGICAEYGIYFRCNSDGNIRKPYLIVSGIDPMNKNRVGDDSSGEINLYRVANKDGYLDDLRDDGYDIIIYRSKQSTESIITNAMNLVGFIQKINADKVSDQELIITGASMGGLIVRYALTYMEKYNIDHQTKLFVSLDSPQNGANTTLGMQYMIKYLYGDMGPFIENYLLDALEISKEKALDGDAARQMLLYHYGSTSGYKAYPDPKRTAYLNSLKSIGDFPKNCRNIAISFGSGVGTNQGFSPGQRLLSKNSGSLNGGLVQAGLVLKYQFDVYAVPNHTLSRIYYQKISAEVCTPVPTCCPISWRDVCVGVPGLSTTRSIHVDNTMPIDNAPGSIYDLHNTKGILDVPMGGILQAFGLITYDPNPDCFIPAYSALGLNEITNPHTNIKSYFNSNSSRIKKLTDNLYYNTGGYAVSWFDMMYIENTNQGHIYDRATKVGVFSSELLDVMKAQASPDNMFIEDKSISNAQSVAYEARNTLTLGTSVDSNPYNNGDVTVANGGDLSLSASQSVKLKMGFHAKAGSHLSVRNATNSYCPSGSVVTSKVEEDLSPKETVNPSSEISHEQDVDVNLYSIVEKFSEPVIFYPNPTKNELLISSNKENNEVFLYNMEGVLLLNKDFTRSVELDLSNMHPGVYIVKVIQENGNVIKEQIVKQ